MHEKTKIFFNVFTDCVGIFFALFLLYPFLTPASSVRSLFDVVLFVFVGSFLVFGLALFVGDLAVNFIPFYTFFAKKEPLLSDKDLNEIMSKIKMNTQKLKRQM